MGWTLAALAERVGGAVHGDAQTTITGAASIEAAQTGQITFVLDRRQLSRLAGMKASAVVVSSNDLQDARVQPFPAIAVGDPQSAFMTIAQILRPPRTRPPRGISPHAIISETATIGDDCWIGPGAVIGDDVIIGCNCDIHPAVVIGDGSRIGDNVVLYPHVVLYHETIIEDRCILHAGSVIGADGFGYRFVNQAFEKIPHLGWVHIHADCEIGAGAMVDRGMIGATVIGQGTKIDNMVQVAHNVQIGKHNVLAAQVGVAGSCKTGDYVRIGGQVGLKDHITLNSGSSIGAKAAVTKDVPAGETWIGYPATPETEQKRLVFSLRRVPEMREQLKAMEARIAELTTKMNSLLDETDRSPQIRAA